MSKNVKYVFATDKLIVVHAQNNIFLRLWVTDKISFEPYRLIKPSDPKAHIHPITDESDFSESCWDLIWVGAQNETAETQSSEITDQEKRSLLSNKLTK